MDATDPDCGKDGEGIPREVVNWDGGEETMSPAWCLRLWPWADELDQGGAMGLVGLELFGDLRRCRGRV